MVRYRHWTNNVNKNEQRMIREVAAVLSSRGAKAPTFIPDLFFYSENKDEKGFDDGIYLAYQIYLHYKINGEKCLK